MPGYVIHIAQAYRILDILGTAYDLPAAWREAFVTGNLLPDTRLKAEKEISHFWNPADLDKIAKAPDLSIFLGKYGNKLDEPVLLGYLSHLFLDALYVERFWPRIISFQDAEGRQREKSSEISRVFVNRLGTTVPVADFFSEKYYYGDYTKMNAYFMDKYKISPPVWEEVRTFDMDEVCLTDMALICNELIKLRGRCHRGDEEDLKVFCLEELEEFMEETCREFLADERWKICIS